MTSSLNSSSGARSLRIARASMQPWQFQDWQCLVLLCVVCGGVFFPWLGSPGILNSSDAYYSEGAREMVESGNYLTPHLNYKPWFEKPILNYWLIAVSYHVFGITEFAARFPSAFSGVTLVLLTFVLGRMFVRRRAALLSALVLTASPLFLVISRTSLTDGPLTALVSFAMMALFTVLNGGTRIFLWLSYVALGLSVLLKGPIGVVLAGGAVVIYFFVTGRTFKSAVQAMLNLKPFYGLAIIILIAAPWFIAEHVATSGAFTREFFIEQNLGRAAGSVSTHHNPDAWWFYVPYVVGGFFPWLLMLGAAPQFLKHIWTRRNSTLSRNKLLVFAASWACLVLVLFNMLPTKLGTYILPAFPAMAYLVGICLESIIRLRKIRFLSWFVLGFLGLGAVALVVLPLSHKIPATFLPAVLSATVLVLSGLCLTLLLLRRRYMAKAVFMMTGFVVAGCGIFVPLGVSVYYVASQQDFHELVELARTANVRLATYATSPAPAVFYLHRQVPQLNTPESWRTFRSTPESKHWLLVRQRVLERNAWIAQQTVLVDRRGKWCLLSLKSVPDALH